MALVIIILYLSLSYLRPFEFLPELQPLHLMQIVGGLALLMTIAYLPMTPFRFRSKQLLLMGAFSIMVFISPIMTMGWFGGSVAVLAEFGITVIVFVMLIINVTTASRLRAILITISALSCLLVLQSIAAIHFGFYEKLLVLTQAVDFMTNILRVRGTGFLHDPNDLAQALVLSVPLICLGWQKGRLPRNLFLVIVPLTGMMYAIYLTHSRGAILSLLVVMMVAIRRKVGNALAGIFTAFGFLAGILMNFAGGRAMSSADNSAIGRLEAWSKGLELLKAHPLFGVGYNEFTTHNQLTAHNSVVLCFTELGFPAFCLWVGLLLVGLLELNAIQKAEASTPEHAELKRYARAIQISFYGFLTAAWFLSRTYITTLYILVALSAAVGDMARRSGLPMKEVGFPRLARLSAVASAGLIVFVYMTVKFAIR
jgi:O-antigen ligase